MQFNLHQHDRDAARRKHFRELACRSEPWTIAGKEIRVMTIEDYHTLLLIESPVLCGGKYSEEAVAQFLWFLSTDYHPTDKALREKFIKDIALKLYGTRHALNDYLDFLFLDYPSSAGNGRSIAVSLVMSLIHAFASNYHWIRSEIVSTPLPMAFQLLKLIRISNNPKAPDFDGSERIKDRFLCYTNTLSPDEMTAVIERVNAGETIEIPD